jgi:predicted esterase
MHELTRRDFVQSAGLSLLAAACCKRTDAVANQPERSGVMLYSRPGTPTEQAEPGLHPLGLGTGRDGFIYIPPTYTPLQPSPLLVLMHGAGQSAREFTRGSLGEVFDKDAIVVVIPDSRNATWDMIYGEYGPDVRFIDRALDLAFTKCRIDPNKIALGGFSDGATYALSLGITNANLFHTVLAFSPGFVKPAVKTGKPRIFIGHGRQDEILPIDLTSREIVAALKEKNYPVKFEEFEGGHTMTRQEVLDALEFFLQKVQ